MKLILTIILLALSVSLLNAHGKKCKHSEIIQKQREKGLSKKSKLDQIFENLDDLAVENRRVLEDQDYTPQELGIGDKPAPIRITPVYQLQNIHEDFHEVIRDSIEVSLQYLRDVLYVYPELNPIKVAAYDNIENGNEGFCESAADDDHFEILPEFKTTGFPDTDLVLIVGAFTEEDSSTLAYAGACQWHHDRATVGRIIFETGWYSDVYNQSYGGDFEESVETTLHEIIHVLGFTEDLYPFFRTAQGKRMHPEYGWGEFQITQLVRDAQRIVLRTPNLQKYTREHFGCNTLEGPFIEDEGGSGSAGSHWEQSIFQNEVMQPQGIQSDAVTSIMTLAFLKDSNWYADVDLSFAESLQWGKNRGCDFVATCEAETFPEFVTPYVEDCDFFHFGYGVSKFTTFGDLCPIISLSPDEKQCTKQHGNDAESAITGEIHGHHSKCFISSVIQTGESLEADRLYRCNKFECIDGSLKIFFGSENNFVTCTTSNQGNYISGPAGYDGNIKCPDNVNEFCQYPVSCENYCGKKGYCHRINGQNQCHCIDGYTGETCEIEVQQDQKYSVQGEVNHVTECALGYYLDKAVNTCKECHSNCQANEYCVGPESNQCSQCNYGQYLDGGSCVDTCPDNKFADKATRTCQNCSDDCTVGCVREANNCIVHPQMYISSYDYAVKIYNDVHGDGTNVTVEDVENSMGEEEQQEQFGNILQFFIYSSIFLIMNLF